MSLSTAGMVEEALQAAVGLGTARQVADRLCAVVDLRQELDSLVTDVVFGMAAGERGIPRWLRDAEAALEATRVVEQRKDDT